MTRVLVWKELREQWLSTVAVLALGVVLFISLASTTEYYAATRFEIASAILFVMAWVFGLVAGVQPLAAEFESGTLNWLDALPVSRRQLWRAKAGAAAGLVAAETIVLWAIMMIVASGAHDPQTHVLPILAVSFLFALCGFAGGIFGSAVARSSMGAFGWAIAVQSIMGWALGLVVAAFAVGPGPRLFLVNGGIVLLAVAISAVPLVISARRFGRPDRLRRTARTVLSKRVSEWRAIAWLAWRQSRVVAYVILGIGVLTALILPQIAPHLWPAVGLLLSVAAGAGTFGADQAGGVYRFLGERRVAPGQLWLVKHAARIAPLIAVVAIYFLIGGARILVIKLDPSTVMRSGDEERIDQLLRDYNFNLVLLGPMFGYALGQFFGLITSKETIGAVLALLTAAGVFFAWMPSLVIGGVHFWQWIVPPLVLIAATRPAMWNWLTGRLANWNVALGMLTAVLFAAAGVAGGVYYRTIEAPVRDDPFDVAAFEKSRPKPEDNGAGRILGEAIRRLRTHMERVDADFGKGEGPTGVNPPLFTVRLDDAIVAAQWPADDEQLSRWLDAMFADRWFDDIRVGVKLPLGRVNLDSGPGPHYVWVASIAIQLLEVRALRSTARGEVEPGLDDIGLALDLTRHIESNAESWAFISAARREADVAPVLVAWAVKAAGRHDLIRRAIDMLRSHEERRPLLGDVIKREYVRALEVRPQKPENIKRELYQNALRAPWEEIRTHAILATWFAGVLRTNELSYPDALRRIEAELPVGSPVDWWLLACWTAPTANPYEARREGRHLVELIETSKWRNTSVGIGPHLFANEARARVVLRAAQYQLALMAYQAKTGEPAANLEALVPDYLPSLPADPFGEGPFRYRVSSGERILWTRMQLRGDEGAFRDVPAGQGVLWSVGPDLEDDGAQLNDPGTWLRNDRPRHSDIIFLVPVVKKQ